MDQKRNTKYTRILNIPKEWYEEAEKRALDQPVFEGSRRKEEANEVGCLGEVIAENWMLQNGIPFESKLNETTRDYIVSGDINIDVKTKDRTVPPKDYYDNSVPLYNKEVQRPDYFLFISLERSKAYPFRDIRRFQKAYIVGAISLEELESIGVMFLEGEPDWRNNTNFWTDCLNVQMHQLIPTSETLQLFKKVRSTPSKKAKPDKATILKIQELIAKGVYKDRPLPAI